MTLLLGVVRPDGVAIAADRAAIYAGEESAPGVPLLAEDRCKVFVSHADVAVGIAGHISAPDPVGRPTPDLLVRAHLAAIGAHTLTATAAAIRDVFNTHAATISGAYGRDESQTDQPPAVLTTALVGGRVETGDAARPLVPHMLEVALLTDGTVLSKPIRGATAYGPDATNSHLNEWVSGARGATTLEAALTRVSALIGVSHRAAPALVTPDFDTAHVLLTGPAVHTHHPYAPPRRPRF